jgi:hypothetical protein
MSLANPDHARLVVLPDSIPLDPHLVQALLGSHVTAPYTLNSVFPVRAHRWRPEAGLL